MECNIVTVTYFDYGMDITDAIIYSTKLELTRIGPSCSTLYPVDYSRSQPIRQSLKGYRSYEGLNPEMITTISLFKKELQIFATGCTADSCTPKQKRRWEYRQYILPKSSPSLDGETVSCLTVDEVWYEQGDQEASILKEIFSEVPMRRYDVGRIK
jgi:hypothetical protein